MIRITNPGWVWRPESVGFSERLLSVLESWDGTRYMSGQQCKGVHSDCIGFAFGVVDEMYGRPSPDRTVLPPDTSMHSREKAIGCMKTLRRLYAPNWPVTDGSLEPGDVVVTGATHGGPGHVMLVGPRRNTLWHCNQGIGVKFTGIGFVQGAQTIYGVYRFDDREKWLR